MCFPNFQWMMGHHRFTMSCQARAPTGWVAAVSDPILRGLARYVPYLRWSLVSRVVTVVTVVGSAMAVLAWQVGWWRQKLNEAERSSFVLIPICFIILMVYTEGMCLRQLSVPSFCFSRSLLNHFQHPVKQSAAAKENHERNNIPMWYFRSLAIVTHIYIYILYFHTCSLWKPACSCGHAPMAAPRNARRWRLGLASRKRMSEMAKRNDSALGCQVGGWNSAWIVITVYNCGQFLWQMTICTMNHHDAFVDLNHRHQNVSRSWSMRCLELRNSMKFQHPNSIHSWGRSKTIGLSVS